MIPTARNHLHLVLTAAIPLIWLALLLGGCDEKGAETEMPNSPRPEKTDVSTAAQVEQRGKAEGVASLEFLPSYPTAEEDLWVQVRGAAALSWEWKRNGIPLEHAEKDRLSRMHFKKGDKVTVTVETPDGLSKESVVIGNAPPRINTVYLQNVERRGGNGIEALPEAFDADGDPISFDFIWERNGSEVMGIRSATLPSEMVQSGDRISLQVTPSDGESSGKPFFGEPMVVPNSPPYFVTTPPSLNDFSYLYRIRCEDPDGDSVSYHLEKCPSGMKLDSETGLLTWNVASKASGTQRIRIVAKDENGAEAVQEFDLKIVLGNL